jgi:hypothetical protein
MAGREYNPFEGPLCSFEEAILWFAYRNNAKVRATPSLFSLREWPDKITKALLLLSRDLARERQTINSFASFAMRPLVEVAFYRRVWALKTEEAMIGRTEALPPIERKPHASNRGGRRHPESGPHCQNLPSFHRCGQGPPRPITLDTDSLTQVFPPGSPKQSRSAGLRLRLSLRRSHLRQSPDIDPGRRPDSTPTASLLM